MSREPLLRRAVTISLFSWRRAAPDDALDDADRQGWWGDCVPSEAGDQIGSRMYLLRRRTLTDDTLRDAREYAEEALRWMTDDDIVTTVTVTAERLGNDRLNLVVLLTELNGETLKLAFEDTWSLINAV
ncbi:phage GP46 family protein [Pseudomonas sp. CIP-10]|uniref:phage GP46 family protein n=1 Tax=Pseudomonas sp. CIP-10 TaxID=2892442 RepID=UPI001E3A4924|nr:phage GP46 family protein [Pseudomonas sp. CIP-10]UFH28831.1 phage GP46 family protein [Pseudomonas sp. CIP-10]